MFRRTCIIFFIKYAVCKKYLIFLRKPYKIIRNTCTAAKLEGLGIFRSLQLKSQNFQLGAGSLYGVDRFKFCDFIFLKNVPNIYMLTMRARYTLKHYLVSLFLLSISFCIIKLMHKIFSFLQMQNQGSAPIDGTYWW